jgi:adenylate cyclase
MGWQFRKMGNLDAWAAYQRGLWHLEKTTPNDDALAYSYFRQAIDLDPNFPGGYTGLAYAQERAARRHGVRETESMETARSAVRLDPNDAEARVCLGFMLLWQGNLTGAFAESEAALTLSPNLASAHGLMGSVQNWLGQWARARAALENSIRLDPRNPNLSIRFNAVTIGYYLSGDYEAAIKAAKRSIHAYPERENDYRWLAAALGQLGGSKKRGKR